MGINKINSWDEDRNYPRICMDYIHQNPVNAGIVMKPEDWMWSSYQEINNNGSRDCLVNLERLKNVLPL
jgi:hypothetical protein